MFSASRVAPLNSTAPLMLLRQLPQKMGVFCTYRYFERVAHYAFEVRLFKDSMIQPLLPTLVENNDNLDSSVTTLDGFAFPPYIVMDRGTPLSEWKRIERQILSVLDMLAEAATLLQTLHGTGRVHCDLKPDNILLVLRTSEWRFIDFRIMAEAGVFFNENRLAYCPGGGVTRRTINCHWGRLRGGAGARSKCWH
jgi:serine/threonine protein kinase